MENMSNKNKFKISFQKLCARCCCCSIKYMFIIVSNIHNKIKYTGKNTGNYRLKSSMMIYTKHINIILILSFKFIFMYIQRQG